MPTRPALAVKVDNYLAARPQSGLDAADIVFEEPVEGGITRYVAVFQCQNAAEVGPDPLGPQHRHRHPRPVRPARSWSTWAGSTRCSPTSPHSPITEIDLRIDSSVVQNPPGRFAPYDTYAATAALWALRPAEHTPPGRRLQLLAGSRRPAPRRRRSRIPYAGVRRRLDTTTPRPGSTGASTAPSPDVLADGAQNAAANVIVQVVQVTYGPWLENDEGGLEVQANLYEDASGPAEVFRNGVEITGTWTRDSLGQPTQLRLGVRRRRSRCSPAGPGWSSSRARSR